MRVEILAVGTELLLGEIANTDAQDVSQGLSELGLDVLYPLIALSELGMDILGLCITLLIVAGATYLLLTNQEKGPASPTIEFSTI